MNGARTITVHEHYAEQVRLLKALRHWQDEAVAAQMRARRAEAEAQRLRQTYVEPLKRGIIRRLIHAITMRGAAQHEAP